MNRHHLSNFAQAAFTLLLVQGCADAPAPTELAGDGVFVSTSANSPEQPGRHIVLFAAAQVPPGFAERVASLGGSVEASLDDVGIAVLTGLTPSAAAELAGDAGIQAVEPDPI